MEGTDEIEVLQYEEVAGKGSRLFPVCKGKDQKRTKEELKLEREGKRKKETWL